MALNCQRRQDRGLENSLFSVPAPSTTFRSGSPEEPIVPPWPVKVTHGHWGWEGTWGFIGGKMSCDFWGQILQRSDGMELSEALYNLPRQLSAFLKTRPAKQGLILCCKFSPNLQVTGAEASEMRGKCPHRAELPGLRCCTSGKTTLSSCSRTVRSDTEMQGWLWGFQSWEKS